MPRMICSYCQYISAEIKSNSMAVEALDEIRHHEATCSSMKCRTCGKEFVPDNPNNEFCGVGCFLNRGTRTPKDYGRK